MQLPTFQDVRQAAERIAPHVHRTPVATSATMMDQSVVRYSGTLASRPSLSDFLISSFTVRMGCSGSNQNVTDGDGRGAGPKLILTKLAFCQNPPGSRNL